MTLEACLCMEVETANQWYNENGVIVNETKHQALILGDTEYYFLLSSERVNRQYIWYEH